MPSKLRCPDAITRAQICAASRCGLDEEHNSPPTTDQKSAKDSIDSVSGLFSFEPPRSIGLVPGNSTQHIPAFYMAELARHTFPLVRRTMFFVSGPPRSFFMNCKRLLYIYIGMAGPLRPRLSQISLNSLLKL